MPGEHQAPPPLSSDNENLLSAGRGSTVPNGSGDPIWTQLLSECGRLEPSTDIGAVVPSTLLPTLRVHRASTAPIGVAADLEKYLEAALAGRRVIRLGPKQLTKECIGRLMANIQVGDSSAPDASRQ